jgi:hypothetical protein
MLNITTATTAELVAFYNANAAAAVKKFADRKTAERRVSTLIESLQATKQVAAKKVSKPKAPKVYKTHEERSEAIAKSWLVPATADARTTRHAVEVVTPEGLKMGFRSTKEAFETLELPLGQHIRFRGQLKASKAKQFTSTDGVYQFAIAHEVIRAAA